jgi:hypothetical protein
MQPQQRLDTYRDGPSAKDRIVGRVLTGVRYFVLPDSHWQQVDGLHQLDFGLDLEFAELVVGATWNVATQALSINRGSLREDLLDAEEIDVGMLDPWSRVIGNVVSDVLEGAPDVRASKDGEGCVWSAEIRFGDEVRVWLVAAAYSDEPGVLLPCSDELIVITEPQVASRLGLT